MENLSCSKCVCDETDLQLKPKKISKNLWKLAYPTMISAGLQNFYDIVDMVWVGQISKTALSGVTLFSSIYMLFTILNEVAGASSVSMISQNYGRGDMEKTQRIAEQTISFKVVLAVISGSLLALFFKTDFMVFSSGSRSFKFRFRIRMVKNIFYSCNVFFIFGKYDF